MAQRRLVATIERSGRGLHTFVARSRPRLAPDRNHEVEESKPIRDFIRLTDPKQIGSLAHRDRLAILWALGDGSRTGADLARELELPANRVHYHLAQLLDRGLIEEIGRGRKRWKEERFFRASARHYVVDPNLGAAKTKAAETLTHSIEEAFLEWHRDELLEIDLGHIARVVVERGLRLRSGENVLLMYGPDGFDLTERLQVELSALGCRTFSRLWSTEMMRAMLERLSLSELDRLSFVPPEQDGALDAVIFLSGSSRKAAPPGPELLEKLPALMRSVSRWQRSLHDRRIRYLEFALPFRREFDIQGTGSLRGATPEEAIEIFWGCIDADHQHLVGNAQALTERLVEPGELQFTCPMGTDLRLRVDCGRAFLLDGSVSTEDVATGRCFEGLPAGTLNYFPIDGSAEGIFRADYTFQAGAHVESLILTLREGRIVDLRAERNEEVLKERLSGASGDADLLSGVRFGLNPAGRGPTGKPILDACLAGTVTLHFGNNELQGGDVRSTLDLIMPACHVTVESGGARLVDAGRLMAMGDTI